MIYARTLPKLPNLMEPVRYFIITNFAGTDEQSPELAKKSDGIHLDLDPKPCRYLLVLNLHPLFILHILINVESLFVIFANFFVNNFVT